MTIVNLDDVLLIRQKAEEFLKSQAQLLRFLGTTTEDGGIIQQYAPPENIICRIINRSGDVTSSAAAQFRALQQSSTRQLYRIQIPYDLQVSLRDRIIYNGKVFDIKYVPVRHELMGAQIIFVEELD
jgi:SPP1 family predicted phage head-tail adaptor